MSLEVGQVNHEVVVGQVLPHDVVLQVLMVLNGDANLAELVHQIDSKDRVEAVLMNSLPVLPGVLAGAAVGRAALHDGAVQLFHQLANKRRFQIVRVTAFTSRYFHADAACSLHAQCLIDFNQRLWRYFLREIHLTLCRCHQRCHQRPTD